MNQASQNTPKRNLVLALECAAGSLSVVLMTEGGVIALSEGDESHAKVSELAVVVNDVLGQAEVSLQEVRNLAVSIGPGSYTGIRSGIAFAKGIQAGSELDVRMIPLTYAMTRSSGARGIVGAVVRVGRSECAYEIFSGSERLLYDVVASDTLGETIERLTADRNVVEWEVDPRLRDVVFGVKANLRIAADNFAFLIGSAVSEVESIAFDETAYLASKF